MSDALTEPAALPELQRAEMSWWQPENLRDAMQMAKMLSESELVPQNFRGKPGNVIAAWTLGSQLGLSLFSALQHIMVINGRPTLWGDGALAVVRAHPEFQDIHEELAGEGIHAVATCTVWRKGSKHPTVRTFSAADAKQANLWGKAGPWKTYPERMLRMRARGFAIRDAFADALCGCGIVEEVRDIERDVTEEVTVRTEPTPALSRTEEVLARARTVARELRPKQLVDGFLDEMLAAETQQALNAIGKRIASTEGLDEDGKGALKAAFAQRRKEIAEGEPNQHTDEAEEREAPDGFDPEADADMVMGGD